MTRSLRIDSHLTGTARLAAYSLVLLLAFLASGCRQETRISTASASLASGSCSEALLVAQAWKCLTTRTALP